MKSVLFVCMGNICRSPAGEAVLSKLAEQRGVPLRIDSAGTHDYHVGGRADLRMRAAAQERGYDLTSRARHVQTSDLTGTFDRVIAMDRDNLANLKAIPGGDSGTIRLFSEYLDREDPRDIPDPYYGEADGFETVIDLMEKGCPKILDDLFGPVE